jgi:hypothetical protein
VASEDNKLLQRALAPSFKECGFLKRGSTWRRASPHAIVVFNIQGSQWGRQFYLNLGAYFRHLGPELAPPEYRCHVRVRLSTLVPDPGLLGKLLNFDEGIPAADRSAQLVAAVSEFAMPWLHAMSACDTARSYLGNHGALARSMRIARDARDLLGVSSGAQQGAAADDRPQAGDRG